MNDRCVQALVAILFFWLYPTNATLFGQSDIKLADVSTQIDAKFTHFGGRSGKQFIVETILSGMASLDYDGDGWTDIYLLNGAPLLGQSMNPAPTNRLFRNVGGFQFVDVTESSGAGDAGFGLGVTSGDYDNDGDQDLFLSNFGPNVLLINHGDGTFERFQFPNAKSNPRVGAGVSLLDRDHDGNLDIFFGNYIDFSFDKNVSRLVFGVRRVAGPKDYDPDTDTLLANRGDGTFEDVSVASGVASVAGPSMGTLAFDFDMDGDTDIFVCNDSAANFLYQNDGQGHFSEVGLLSGVAYDVSGSQQATMGADLADFDGDGYLDLVTTNFADEIPTLYKNSGLGYFDDIGPAVGLGTAIRNLKWGVAFSDWDNDTWPDLVMVLGHLIEEISKINDSEVFAARNVYMRNLEGKKFSNISAKVGSAGESIKASRAVIADDLDNDGDMDSVVLNLNDTPQWIRNDTNNAHAWLELRLVGTNVNRDAVGARVTVLCNGRKLVQEVLSGRGYQSHFGTRLHFGLGSADKLELEVQWPGGKSQKFSDVSARQYILVRENLDQVRRLR